MPEDVIAPGSDGPQGSKKYVLRLPPKSSVITAPDGRLAGARIAMWEIWLEIAERHAQHASDCELPRPDLEEPGESDELRVAGSGELEHSMLAITAAAFCIDGLYGSVRNYVRAPISNAARERVILEALKHGFRVGKRTGEWMIELDWLFEIRDRIVHHSDDYEPIKVVHETDDLLVAIPAGLNELSSASAARAARFAREVVETCRANPKPATVQWVRGRANWDPGPGETLDPTELRRRLFPLVRD